MRLSDTQENSQSAPICCKPQKYATGCELPVNKQYVETRSKYRGRGIMSHEERGITQQKERVMRENENLNKNVSTRNWWRQRWSTACANSTTEGKGISLIWGMIVDFFNFVTHVCLYMAIKINKTFACIQLSWYFLLWFCTIEGCYLLVLR